MLGGPKEVVQQLDPIFKTWLLDAAIFHELLVAKNRVVPPKTVTCIVGLRRGTLCEDGAHRN